MNTATPGNTDIPQAVPDYGAFLCAVADWYRDSYEASPRFREKADGLLSEMRSGKRAEGPDEKEGGPLIPARPEFSHSHHPA